MFISWLERDIFFNRGYSKGQASFNIFTSVLSHSQFHWLVGPQGKIQIFESTINVLLVYAYKCEDTKVMKMLHQDWWYNIWWFCISYLVVLDNIGAFLRAVYLDLFYREE